MWNITRLLLIFWGFQSSWSQLFQCHEDSSYTPEEGPLEELQYSWLGTLQYIHIQKGHPHYFRVPRVVLISRQHVLSTAKDAAELPDGYALGNVVFGEYERDETECGLTVEALGAGAECAPAAMLMPLWDVLLHPEYQAAREAHTIALLKLLIPIKSYYMVPACLPLYNYLFSKSGESTGHNIFHFDFSSVVPRDIMDEEKEVTKLTLLPWESCYSHNGENTTDVDPDTSICTTGCDLHSGAPSMLHEQSGHWALVALARGGSPCPDPLGTGRPFSPPRHTMIHPYVPWIMASIMGKAYVDGSEKYSPFEFSLPRALSTYDTLASQAWNGHWWGAGPACASRGSPADSYMYKFYQELFRFNLPIDRAMTYVVEIEAPEGTRILCVKVGMKNRLFTPVATGLNSHAVMIRIPMLKYSGFYRFEVEAWSSSEPRGASSETKSEEADPSADSK